MTSCASFRKRGQSGGAVSRADGHRAGLAGFHPEAVRAIARIAAQVNEAVENIGARRLQTVMEKLLEELSFEAEDRRGETIVIDEAYVSEKLEGLARDTDLSKYIL
jgi:ATP-dependent HslUV protease ATP-binding subunit HslU